MTYPTWAPPLLIELHKRAVENVGKEDTSRRPAGAPSIFLDRESRESLLRALTTDQRMAGVWHTLSGWSKEFKARLPESKSTDIPDELLEMQRGEEFRLSLRTNQMFTRTQPGSLYRACEAAL